MNKEDIEKVLLYPGFKSYTPDQQVRLKTLLETTQLTLNQLDLLFNEESVSGGIICQAVEESGTNLVSAQWLWKIANNQSESPDGTHPSVPIIQTLIEKLHAYTPEMANDVKQLVSDYVEIHNCKMVKPQPQPQISQTSTSSQRLGSSRLFNPLPKDMLDAIDGVTALMILHQHQLDTPWNCSFLTEHASVLPGIIFIFNHLSKVGLLNQENINRYAAQTPHVAHITVGISRFTRDGLFKPETAQAIYEKIISQAHLSGPDYLAFLKNYEKELRNPAQQVNQPRRT